MERKNKHVQVNLIKGNHDRGMDGWLQNAAINIYDSPLIVKGFQLSHHPEGNGIFTFAGHIHPAVWVTGRGRQKKRVCCFYVTDKYCLLPAFGSFTGSYIIEPEGKGKAYLIAGEEIIEYKKKLLNYRNPN